MIEMSRLSEKSAVVFGTSGARGLVTAMTDEVCWAYTRAFLQGVAPMARRVVLGQDLRPSSARIAQACAAAIAAQGAEVINAGVLPTPALASFSLAEGVPAVMVTGSHIPFDRNGLKFYSAAGEITKADEVAILAARLPEADIYSQPLPQRDARPAEHYLRRYLAFFPPGFLVGRRIGVYEHSSVARDLLPVLLTALGAEVVALGRSDSFVPVDTEAVGAETQALGTAWAREHRLDAILSTDGDADRPLIADETGHWLRGDLVGLLCARYLGARVVATPVSCNTAIERCGAFAQVRRTRIGSPYVIEAMQAVLAEGKRRVVGFEANGGFLLGDAVIREGRRLEALPTRDAVLPVLALLAQAQATGKPLSALADDLPSRFTASDRLQDFANARSCSLLTALSGSAKSVQSLLGESLSVELGELTGVDETDGLRMTFAQGDIVHLRPSGNAPELRCYTEAATQGRAICLVKGVLERVQSSGELV